MRSIPLICFFVFAFDTRAMEGRRLFEALPQMSQRMAFYAGTWRKGDWTIPLDTAKIYSALLPTAIGLEADRMSGGAEPRRLTPGVVVVLIEASRCTHLQQRADQLRAMTHSREQVQRSLN